jgi:hypothetical protein
MFDPVERALQLMCFPVEGTGHIWGGHTRPRHFEVFRETVEIL